MDRGCTRSIVSTTAGSIVPGRPICLHTSREAISSEHGDGRDRGPGATDVAGWGGGDDRAASEEPGVVVATFIQERYPAYQCGSVPWTCFHVTGCHDRTSVCRYQGVDFLSHRDIDMHTYYKMSIIAWLFSLLTGPASQLAGNVYNIYHVVDMFSESTYASPECARWCYIRRSCRNVIVIRPNPTRLRPGGRVHYTA